MAGDTIAPGFPANGSLGWIDCARTCARQLWHEVLFRNVPSCPKNSGDVGGESEDEIIFLVREMLRGTSLMLLIFRVSGSLWGNQALHFLAHPENSLFGQNPSRSMLTGMPIQKIRERAPRTSRWRRVVSANRTVRRKTLALALQAEPPL
jgi:hypothetical protein